MTKTFPNQIMANAAANVIKKKLNIYEITKKPLNVKLVFLIDNLSIHSLFLSHKNYIPEYLHSSQPFNVKYHKYLNKKMIL